MDDTFKKVKGAVSDAPESIARDLGVKHIKGDFQLNNEWTTGFLCLFCSDTSGSASFTRELYLKCHQCSYKGDVFDWVARHLGKKPWDVCKMLAEKLKVDIKLPANKALGRSTSTVPSMSDTMLSHAIRMLWESPDAEFARNNLAERKVDDQRILSQLEVGFVKGWISFPSRNADGKLNQRWRGWSPKDQVVKWRWFGAGTGGPGIWPIATVPEGKRIMLCEGESDLLAAMVRLRLHECGWHVATWTAGATSCPKLSDIPKSWEGKEVHVCYDNDVFQGPDYDHYVVQCKPGKNPDHARTAAENRLKNLLLKLCPLLSLAKCKVFVRQCPVNPAEIYGGDMRDWIDGGGHDFDRDWKCFKFEDLPRYGKPLLEVGFDEAFTSLGREIRTIVQVELVGSDDVVIPRILKMECDLGKHNACSQCHGLQHFPSGMIDMREMPRELTVAIDSKQPHRWLIEHVVQPPKTCPRLELVSIESGVGSEWRATRPGHSDDTTQRFLKVVSEDPPSLSGEVEITGIPYNDSRGNAVAMHATRVIHLDKTEIDLRPLTYDLSQATPCFSNQIEHIEEYLVERWRDLSFNVTRIHGRKDILIAHDLMAHSAIGFKFNGAVHRGWLDICVFGETRSGKSMTFRRMFEHHGLGVYHTAVSNISRAGLVMGASKDGLMKPGLWPKCHRKMLMLDEWHFLIQNAMKSNQDHPMGWLQSGRDEGRVSGVKIYGSRDLPAKVRFCAIANWMRNRRRTFEHACEHLGALYGSPETLARLDFGLPVGPRPTQIGLDEAEAFWTRERTRALILRAWAQEADGVHIEPEAEKLAIERSDGWRDTYDSERIPLYTPEEKALSVMRIAVAVANLTFSHQTGEPDSVHVRPVHVEWAALWLEHVWRESGYDRYSDSRKHSETVSKPFEAERWLSVSLGLEDPMTADSVLTQFLEPVTMAELNAITGKESYETVKWISRLQALNVFERVKDHKAYGVAFHLTRGGDKLVTNMLNLARHDQEQWFDRYRRIDVWGIAVNPPGGMKPMTSEPWELFEGGDSTGVPF